MNEMKPGAMVSIPSKPKRTEYILQRLDEIDVRLGNITADLDGGVTRLGVAVVPLENARDTTIATGFLSELDLILVKLNDRCDELNSLVRSLIEVV